MFGNGISFSAMLFFWPYLIGFLFLILRRNKLNRIKPENKKQDIEDAQIIEEENSSSFGAGD